MHDLMPPPPPHTHTQPSSPEGDESSDYGAPAVRLRHRPTGHTAPRPITFGVTLEGGPETADNTNRLNSSPGPTPTENHYRIMFDQELEVEEEEEDDEEEAVEAEMWRERHNSKRPNLQRGGAVRSAIKEETQRTPLSSSRAASGGDGAAATASKNR
jgi:hypothetical protein